MIIYVEAGTLPGGVPARVATETDHGQAHSFLVT